MIDPQLSKSAVTSQQSPLWSQTQLLSLTDNDHHRRSSRQFASLKRWRDLSRSQRYIWADFVARDGVTVRTTLRLSPLSFKCECSQRVVPCFHSLGLALLYAEQPEAFAASKAATPDFSTTFSYTLAPSLEAQRKRYAELMTGLEALELWCHDLIRDGLESADRPKSYAQISDRLVDARAPKLAQDVRTWSKPSNNQDWHAALLADLGEWQLVIEGFKRLYELPESVQADLKLRVGWLPSEAREDVWDTWQVLGRRAALVQGKRQQRVWLWGQRSKRRALLVHTPAEKMQRETSLLTGASVRAELSFFASSTPLRAELKTWEGYEAASKGKPPACSVMEASSSISLTLAKNPWRTVHPLVLSGISFEFANDTWFVRDTEGYALPLIPKCRHIWQLIALARSGMTLFGEWDERRFRPLSIWQTGIWPEGWLDLRVLRGRK